MATSGQRKCMNCCTFFNPDQRNKTRQHYCSKPECRRASKAASQAAWLAKPANVDYFADPVHVARVQAWRAANPGYARTRRKSPGKGSVVLQDALLQQPIDSSEETAHRSDLSPVLPAPPPPPLVPALQDSCNTPLRLEHSPLLLGLVVHLFGPALQDDIDATITRLVQIGTDITYRSQPHEDPQTRASP